MTQGVSLAHIGALTHKYVICAHTRTQARLFLYLSNTNAHTRTHTGAKTKLAVSPSQPVKTDLTECVHCLRRAEEYRGETEQ